MMHPSTNGQLCDRARQWASLRVDDEISELEEALLDAHLARCACCSAFAEETGRVAAALRSVAQERPEAPVVISIPRRRRRVRVLGTAVACTLALAAALAGSLVGVADHASTPTVQATKRTAMIASAEPAIELRVLRRPGLQSSHPIPHNRVMVGDVG
jgi:predicted anti-sigma-YlaC factor YlaD